MRKRTCTNFSLSIAGRTVAGVTVARGSVSMPKPGIKNKYLEMIEEWTAEIISARDVLPDIEMIFLNLYRSGVLSEEEMNEIRTKLNRLWIGNARGQQFAKWIRRYPPDLGSKWPPDENGSKGG